MKHKIALATVTVALLGSLHVYVQSFTPPSGPRLDREVEYAEGASFKSVALELKRQGIIRNAELFTFRARMQEIDRGVKAGTYALNSSMRPGVILDIFRQGRIIEVPVTIPEGYTAAQIAALLEKKGLVEAVRFMEMVEDSKLIASLGVEGPTLEGYLFPDTYLFPKGIRPAEIMRKMVRRYRDVFTPEMTERAKELGLSERGVITIASIVEKEVRVDEERPLVAAVCYNRLRTGMPLQSDPTVIYGLGPLFDGDLKRRDMRMKSPYNTYVYRGLPPGPIANPGRQSIMAALYPADSKYLYFVARNDGTHFFSCTYEEHSSAVRQYQLKGRKAPDKEKSKPADGKEVQMPVGR